MVGEGVEGCWGGIRTRFDDGILASVDEFGVRGSFGTVVGELSMHSPGR